MKHRLRENVICYGLYSPTSCTRTPCVVILVIMLFHFRMLFGVIIVTLQAINNNYVWQRDLQSEYDYNNSSRYCQSIHSVQFSSVQPIL